MIIPVKTSVGSYQIVLERGAINDVSKYLNVDRKCLIVTDSGVPSKYSELVASACKDATVFSFPMGEAFKNIETYSEILKKLVENNFTRADCVIAVGGGVVGDMAGFAAATFMRGIDFYNIPTTVLSQVDSSIGGKTAIDFCGIKNIVGAFYPPKAVVIDPETLKTLPARQISNGLAEALKMSLTSDAELFDIFENGDPVADIDRVIEKSLYIKRDVVEQDEKETGLRKILNFGHTLAHAYESISRMQDYYHGECVALGMIPMCSENVRARLVPVLQKLNLPTKFSADAEEVLSFCRHDKKMSGNSITVVFVDAVGKYELKKLDFQEFEKIVCEV